MAFTIVSEWKSFGGRQLVIEHPSTSCGVPMRFSLFLPPGTENPPIVYFLSGLTCNWENVTTKAGFQREAAALGLAIVAPDTSPRNLEGSKGVHDTPDRWDLGIGAGFYVDATNQPWAQHYQMYTYITQELPAFLAANFPVDTTRQSITGHSMGGHGALVIGLRNPEKYRAISAFSPIVAPSQVPWGQDAFSAYLTHPDEWPQYDATQLVAQHPRPDITIRIDQGQADGFLENQLKPELFAEACQKAAQPLQLNLQQGYDHSYYFIATFLPEHLQMHAAALK